jgi:hypothetical protein
MSRRQDRHSRRIQALIALCDGAGVTSLIFAETEDDEENKKSYEKEDRLEVMPPFPIQ